MKRKLNPKNKVECLICGNKFFHPMSHVYNAHGILSKEYKETFGLDTTKGLVSKDLHEVISENVLAHPEVIENLKNKHTKTRFKKGDTTIGKYKRSEQTLKQLSKLSQTRKKSIKQCKNCNCDFFGYTWKKYCNQCLILRKAERENSPGAKQYRKEWYKKKATNPEFVKERTQKHYEWVEKNKEHLYKYLKARSYSLNRKCADCSTAITNYSKTGKCIHCFNKSRN